MLADFFTHSIEVLRLTIVKEGYEELQQYTSIGVYQGKISKKRAIFRGGPEVLSQDERVIAMFPLGTSVLS